MNNLTEICKKAGPRRIKSTEERERERERDVRLDFSFLSFFLF